MRAGVVGGTFDPPHLAHLALGAAARQALELDRVLFVPAGQPWRKAGRAVTSADVRVRMLRAAVTPLSWAEVSTIEVKRDGPSYATETLPELAASGGDWWFVLGDDALADMPHWHEPEALLLAARLALAWRPPGEATIHPDVLERFPDIEQRIDMVSMSPLDLSSTDLRERVRDGRSTRYLMPEAVRGIVDELGLYRR